MREAIDHAVESGHLLGAEGEASAHSCSSHGWQPLLTYHKRSRLERPPRCGEPCFRNANKGWSWGGRQHRRGRGKINPFRTVSLPNWMDVSRFRPANRIPRASRSSAAGIRFKRQAFGSGRAPDRGQEAMFELTPIA